MTYVTEQTPKELRQHMRQLQKMPGWHAPLDDRLFKEIEAQDAEIERLRAGYSAIMAATVAGRVCDDVAWFDGITTLYDYCDALLAGNEHLFSDAAHQQSAPEQEPQHRSDKSEPSCACGITSAGRCPVCMTVAKPPCPWCKEVHEGQCSRLISGGQSD